MGTDGALPDDLSQVDRERFQAFLFKVTEMVANFAPRHLPKNNDAIACLSWTFTLCPEQAQEAIVTALEAHVSGREHPLLSPNFAITVLIQGRPGLAGPSRGIPCDVAPFGRDPG